MLDKQPDTFNIVSSKTVFCTLLSIGGKSILFAELGDLPMQEHEKKLNVNR